VSYAKTAELNERMVSCMGPGNMYY